MDILNSQIALRKLIGNIHEDNQINIVKHMFGSVDRMLLFWNEIM